jgi:hypothetical protein
MSQRKNDLGILRLTTDAKTEAECLCDVAGETHIN